MRLVLIGISAAALAACATNSGPVASADGVAAATKVSVNAATGAVEAVGPEMKGVGQTWLVRATRPSGAAEWKYQVELAADVQTWANFSEVNADGKSLGLTKIVSRPVPCRAYHSGGCGLQEVVGVNLAASDLDSVASNGLSYTVSGAKHEVKSSVPAFYMKGVMQAVASYEGRK